MCFYSKLSKKAVELENRFKAGFEDRAGYKPSEFINGFSFPGTPVICDADPQHIRLYNWGLVPFWAKDADIRKNTLNARIETLYEKPAFRDSADRRCLVITEGFYEWKWLDPAGKKKQKYLLSIPGEELFALAGIWSEWTDKETGEVLHTYSIVTTEAIGLMEEIHNSKHRMPVVLDRVSEQAWLRGCPTDDVRYKEPSLQATAV